MKFWCQLAKWHLLPIGDLIQKGCQRGTGHIQKGNIKKTIAKDGVPNVVEISFLMTVALQV
uniref:Uncharacterized protein n=1 Tax=Rhizophora mucronata TaxID=61149 RepID=A0A2P2P3U7_RHIMU